MLLITTFALYCMFLVGWLLDRRLLSPPAIFGGVWALTLSVVGVSQRWFFMPTDAALFVYIVGALAFLAGSLFVEQVPLGSSTVGSSHRKTTGGGRLTQSILTVFVVLLLATLPIFIRTALSLAEGAPLASALNLIRLADVEGDASELTRGVLGNLIVLSQFVALACFYEKDGSWIWRARAVVAIILALFLGALGGTKGNAVTLILALFFIASLKQGRLRVSAAVRTVLVVLSIFGLGLWAVNLGANPGAVSATTLGLVGLLVVNYWIGGLIGFSEVVDAGAAYGSNHSASRFFLETARSLGFPVEVPSIHAQWATIGPDQITNTYTIYFSYFVDGGLGGVVIGMLLVGAITTLIYHRALRGSAVAVIVYSVLCVSLVLSIQAEHFALSMNRLIKMLLFLMIVYGAPRLFVGQSISRESN